jgi:hypothetical protein
MFWQTANSRRLFSLSPFTIVTSSRACAQLLRKSYGRVVELGDDGWECTCMVCGREGQLLMCEHGMQASDTVAQCPKVAHPKCVGLPHASDPSAVFICPMHADTCCSPAIREKLDAKARLLDESTGIPQAQVFFIFRMACRGADMCCS